MLFAAVHCAIADESAAEKHVTFYSSYGYQQEDKWIIPLRVWVHEKPDLARQLIARTVRSALGRRAGIEQLSERQEVTYSARVEGFIADSESGESVSISFYDDPDSVEYPIRGPMGALKTNRNGLIEGVLTLPEETADKLLTAQFSDHGWLRFHVTTENMSGGGTIRLLEPTGVSVVSDIDDTIKITGIVEGEQAVLRNTFFEDFRVAPCMAEMYRSFGTDAAFHYVSGGPWQLYGPLFRFINNAAPGFPAGSFHMKNVRTNPFESESYEDIWKLIANGSQDTTFRQKVGQISALLERFPQREFVLIGDSGEQDPEVFSAIRGQYPSQISEIRIRDVNDAAGRQPARMENMARIPPVGCG